MKALFPLNSKDHGMKTRGIMKYNKAKKERYKNSPVIYMQKLLNNDYKRKFISCKEGTVHKLAQYSINTLHVLDSIRYYRYRHSIDRQMDRLIDGQDRWIGVYRVYNNSYP